MLSDAVYIAIAAASPAVVGSITAFLINRQNVRLEEHRRALAAVSTNVIEAKQELVALKVNTDGMKDALVAATKSAAHSAGVIEGTKDEQDRMGRPDR